MIVEQVPSTYPVGFYTILHILLYNGDNINSCCNIEKSPFDIARRYGQVSTMQLLQEYGADINLCSESGTCPLSIAF